MPSLTWIRRLGFDRPQESRIVDATHLARYKRSLMAKRREIEAGAIGTIGGRWTRGMPGRCRRPSDGGSPGGSPSPLAPNRQSSLASDRGGIGPDRARHVWSMWDLQSSHLDWPVGCRAVDASVPRLQRAAAGLSGGGLRHLSYRMKTHRVFRCKQRRRNRKLAKGYLAGMNLARVPGRGIARSVACGFATGTSPIRIGIRAPAINDTPSEFDARSIRTQQTVGRLGGGIGREQSYVS